jgi:hypothetical protein
VFGSPDDVVQCLENEVLSGVRPDQAIARRDGRHGHEARRFRGLPRQHRVGLTRRHLEDARRPQPGEEPAEPLRLGRVGDEGAVLAGGVKGPRLQVGAGHQRDTIVGHHELGVEVVVPADSDAALGHVFEALVVRLQVSGVRIFVRFGLGQPPPQAVIVQRADHVNAATEPARGLVQSIEQLRVTEQEAGEEHLSLGRVDDLDGRFLDGLLRLQVSKHVPVACPGHVLR